MATGSPGTPGSKAAIRDLCQKAATKLKALKEGARETPGNTTIKDMPLSSTPERAWQTKLGVSPGRKQQVFLEKCHLLSKATQIETDELSSSQEDWEVLVCSSSSVQPLDMTPDKDRFYWNTTIQSIKYPSPPPPSLTSFNSSVATVIPNPVASLALEDSKYSLEEREYSRFIEEPPKMESVSMKKEEETVKFDEFKTAFNSISDCTNKDTTELTVLPPSGSGLFSDCPALPDLPPACKSLPVRTNGVPYLQSNNQPAPFSPSSTPDGLVVQQSTSAAANAVNSCRHDWQRCSCGPGLPLILSVFLLLFGIINPTLLGFAIPAFILSLKVFFKPDNSVPDPRVQSSLWCITAGYSCFAGEILSFLLLLTAIAIIGTAVFGNASFLLHLIFYSEQNSTR